MKVRWRRIRSTVILLIVLGVIGGASAEVYRLRQAQAGVEYPTASPARTISPSSFVVAAACTRGGPSQFTRRSFPSCVSRGSRLPVSP